MSERIPKITAYKLVRVVRRLGFVLDRQSGSHAIYYNAINNRRVVIPMHSKKIIKPKTLTGILDDLGIDIKTLKGLI